MTIAIQSFGLLMILGPLWFLHRIVGKKDCKLERTAYCVIILFGVALTLNPRLTELSVFSIGKITASVESAESKVGEIEGLKKIAESTVDRLNNLSADAKASSVTVQGQISSISNDVSRAKAELSQLADLNAKIRVQEAQLSQGLEFAKGELEVQRHFLMAKVGGISNYFALKALVNSNGVASLLIGDLNELFQAYQDAPPKVVPSEPISMKQRPNVVDGLVISITLQNEYRFNREAAFNALSAMKKRNAMGTLCKALESETNAFVACRIMAAIEKTASTNFGVLNTAGVARWWAVHKSDKEYESPYEGLLELVKNGLTYVGPDAPKDLATLDAVIKSEPDAFLSRCFRGALLAFNNRLPEAETEFALVEKMVPDFSQLYYWKAAFYLAKNDQAAAVTSMNKAIEISPTLEDDFKKSPVFAPIKSDPRIKSAMK